MAAVRQVGPLEAAHTGGRHGGTQKSVLARRLHDASPPRIVRNVHHRCIRQMYARRSSFGCRSFGTAAHQRRVPAASLGQGNGREGAVTVNHIFVKHQRNAQPAVLQRFFLQRTVQGGPVGFQKRPDATATDAGPQGGVVARIIRHQIQFCNFLFERHPVQEVLHPLLHRPTGVLIGQLLRRPVQCQEHGTGQNHFSCPAHFVFCFSVSPQEHPAPGTLRSAHDGLPPSGHLFSEKKKGGTLPDGKRFLPRTIPAATGGLRSPHAPRCRGQPALPSR